MYFLIVYTFQGTLSFAHIVTQGYNRLPKKNESAQKV